MPNYTAAALTAAQVAFTAKFSDAEVRRKQNPALMLALKNKQVTITNHKDLKTKDTRPVKAYVKTRRAQTATAAKTHNHAGGKSDSKEVTLNWIQIVEPFSINLKQAAGNIHAYSEMLQHEIAESARNIHNRAGTLALAYLQTNRCQLAAPATGGAGNWNNVNFALEIPANKAAFFFQNASSFMKKQNYRGDLDVIADSMQFRQAQYIANQGGGNNTNLSFQIANMDIRETTEDIDGNYLNGSALIMEAGGFAGLDWNDPVNVRGKGDYDSTLGGYGTIVDPLGSGLLFDIHGYTERVDGSGTGGGVQDENFEAELTLTIGWVTKPLSTANETVVYEVAQMA